MADKDPKRQQMEYMAVGALVLAALFVGVSKFKKKAPDDEVFSRKQFEEKWADVKVLEANVPKREKGAQYATETERIPLKSPFEEEDLDVDEDVTLPSMTFQGMVWSSVRPQAIINSKVYDKGEVIEIVAGEGIDKILIEDIARDGIYLRYKGRQFIVRPK
ncbi:MAG: hypothetical protein KJ706_02125 [Candidatus Omnitrophica bacterium]|nr:hypothetical protein [Candidatus Omnitrophota bacterium]MBU4590291.1 hypothetical protein [Candidatus Omnitrophota bacterium]